MMMTFVRRAAAGLLLSTAPPLLACSSCGCTLTSDWIDQRLISQPGLRVDLRYDYIPQTRLQTGTRRIDPGSLELPNEREIEQSTYNHYVTLGLDYAPSPEWAVNVQLPWIARPHDTIAEGDIDPSHSRTAGFGDARVSARWQGFGGPGITGVISGLKLPTGGIGTRFDRGPQAGEPVDRGLQAGTGTTDALFGFYHFGKLAARFDWFAQGVGQVALNSHRSFRPGNSANISAGVHYTAWRGITPQLQFNLRLAEKDSGADADRDNSGGTLLYVSPGAAVRLGARATGFTFVQLPMIQRVNGYQLVPAWTLSAGVQIRL